MQDKTTHRSCHRWTLPRVLLLSTVLGTIFPWPNSCAYALPYGNAGIELDEENDGISLTACYVEDLRNIREHSQNPLVIEINHCYLQELPNAIFIRFNDLKVLEICDSRVNNLQDFALNGLRNIESLNLSRNNLTTIKSWSDHDLDTLQVLDLRRNLIRLIDEFSFQRYPALVKLNLAVNFITAIPEGTFKPIVNLKNLNLGKNLLTTIAESTLRGLNKLTHVAFHHNRIRTIHPFAFIGNSHLKVVQLQGNQLGSFEPDLFGNLPRLQFLNVSSNELETIGNLSFKNNGDLRVLDLSYNRIGHLEDYSFKGLYDLEALNISHNQLQTVSKYVLKDASNLRDLDISANKLDYISLKLSIATPRLIRLNLSSNAISEIERDAFEDLPKLHTLDLAHNQLTDDAFLWPLMNLSVLNMSQNGFRRINASLLESLAVAELYDNPWDCRFLIQELVHHSSNVIYGKNYLVEDMGRILTANGIECTDERGKHRDIVVVEPPAKPSESELEYRRYKFFHEGHVDTRPIQDNFDTKSTVIWLMSGAIAVFGAFKLIQLLLRHSEHQSEKWRLAQHVSSDEDHEEAARHCSSAGGNTVSSPISPKSATSSGFNFFLTVPHQGGVRQYSPSIK
ncbi:insulin-like growth factor-binding protein complex acid labile subunit isoform X1 [Anopheles maculipalpis]|uniref:insulin-like growth factor-binding protein complex acid labile subunit isoform X1 n=1 Tax=Anopheles maculipalpis TaxID=1496333 RepID=UPI0021595017|nr:insulin-like growth factor-binding protein complex acid labile subunit isoform X1 [Anopheles maculipalpis]